MIEFLDITVKHKKEYNTLQNVSLKITKGDKVAIVGDESSGKDTLLRLLSKEEIASSGDVLINGLNVLDVNYKLRPRLGYLKKMPIFFNNKTVRQNLHYVLKIRGKQLSDIDSAVLQTLKRFNMLDIAEIKIKKLSLYEKMVVAIARLSLRELDVLVIEDYAAIKNYEIYRRKNFALRKKGVKTRQFKNTSQDFNNVFESYEIKNLNEKVGILLEQQKSATILIACESSSALLKEQAFKVVKLKYGVVES